MASRKTWLWVIGGVSATGLLALVGVAGAGMYFVSRHVQSEGSTPTVALQSFDAVTSSFNGRRPLYELDVNERPVLTTPLSRLPPSNVTPDELVVQAWIPDEQRLVRVSLPFWLVRIGQQKMRVVDGHHGFDFNELNLDVRELERIGPALVFDFRNQDGVRVLLWTK